jgi:hypothetical protein
MYKVRAALLAGVRSWTAGISIGELNINTAHTVQTVDQCEVWKISIKKP